MEVDPMAAAQAYRDRVLDPVRELMPADVISNIEEQLSGSCTTEIAAFDEFTALLTSHELREKNMIISSLILHQPDTPSVCLSCRALGAGTSMHILMLRRTSALWWGWRNNRTSTLTQ
uniref:Arsenical pump-driving ATPase TEMP n=1 Tax=Klebsiella pneumoniae TaxID=573 RepID=A0A8B0SVY3_KLEPN|nr:Arsenical pump-driving ATPase TEMP [Klebsiella pneumoniae]